MNTGVLDKNGIEISVGDIVHYRGEGLCAHGEVVEDDYYGFAILDDRPKTKGRRYSLKNEGIYRIEKVRNKHENTRVGFENSKIAYSISNKKRNVGAVFYVNEEDAKNIDDFNYYVSMTEKTNEDGDIVVIAERYSKDR